MTRYVCPLCSKSYVDVPQCVSCDAANVARPETPTNPGRPMWWYVMLVILLVAAVAAITPALIDWMREWILRSRS